MSLGSVVRRPRRAESVRLPEGTVTFLLTDVEASTPSWSAGADDMDGRLRDLDVRTKECVEASGGVLVKTRGEGDSAFAVFERASDAVIAASALQRSLQSSSGLAVRAAVHTGEARLRDGDYFGLIPNRAARLRSLAHGGQIVVSRVSAELAEPGLPEGIRLVSLGSFDIRDWPRVERVFGVSAPGLRSEFPPLRVWGDAQRAVMTVVVVDEVGSSQKARRLAEPDLVTEQRSLARILRDAFKDHRGSHLKFMGDGCVAAFGDPMHAIAFAAAVVGRVQVSVRVAMHAGLVELADDDIVGSALFEAYRLERETAPGEILVSRTVADLVANQGIELTRRQSESGSDDVFVVKPA